jgi:hypothetical protein
MLLRQCTGDGHDEEEEQSTQRTAPTTIEQLQELDLLERELFRTLATPFPLEMASLLSGFTICILEEEP